MRDNKNSFERDIGELFNVDSRGKIYRGVVRYEKFYTGRLNGMEQLNGSTKRRMSNNYVRREARERIGMDMVGRNVMSRSFTAK